MGLVYLKDKTKLACQKLLTKLKNTFKWKSEWDCKESYLICEK